MTGPVAPSSPGQEDAPGTPGDPVQPPEEVPARSPAMARAAKLNAANMVRSLLPLLLICLALVGWQALRQSGEEPVREVDPTSSVRASAEQAGYDVVAPAGLPDGYRPTSARTTAGRAEAGDPVILEIGYLTPEEEFAGFVVGDDRDADPLSRVLDGASGEEQVEISGEAWTRVTTMRGETALTREAGEATVVVFGSASDEELTEVAAAVRPVR
jgi:Protein of unknown function (DUF4245)